jgi:hypothetical protein
MIATGTTRTITTTINTAPSTSRTLPGAPLDVSNASAEHDPSGAGGVPKEA